MLISKRRDCLILNSLTMMQFNLQPVVNEDASGDLNGLRQEIQEPALKRFRFRHTANSKM